MEEGGLGYQEGIGDNAWHHLLDLLPFQPAGAFISTDPHLSPNGWGGGGGSEQDNTHTHQSTLKTPYTTAE